VPPGVDPATAVCLVVNYLTSYLAMHETAKVQSGERVLIHGAGGGTGTALLQLGQLAGLEMYGTASPYNHELVSQLGATPIDYRSQDFVERVRDLTGGGVDVVFDPVGGGRHLRRSFRALCPTGRLVWFGMAATKEKGMRAIPPTLATVALLALMPGAKSVPMMPDLGTFTEGNHGWYRDTLAELFDLAASGKLQPVIAERVPFLEAARAHKVLEHGGYGGKIVLVSDV
jgi:NADPH:quinone reductase-like Zn-dependent oxidoreductase